jgi:hypothetical protein
MFFVQIFKKITSAVKITGTAIFQKKLDNKIPMFAADDSGFGERQDLRPSHH